MAHRVKIAPGVNGITLPNGEQYDEDDEVVLTDAQFDRIAPTALGDEVLDLGEVEEPGGGGGAGLPSTDDASDGDVLKFEVVAQADAEQNIGYDQTGDFPDGGTYTLTIEGNTTTDLAFDAPAEDVAAALEAAWPIGGTVVANNQSIGSLADGVMVFNWTAGADPAAMTIDPTNLTGPSAPYTVGQFDINISPWVAGGDSSVVWGLPLQPGPENQQGILIGATIGGDPITIWYPATRGQMWVGHESAGWTWLDPGDSGTVLQMNEDGDPEWTPTSSGALLSDNRAFYTIDTGPPNDAIQNGDSFNKLGWTFNDSLSTEATDPNTVLESGIMVALAGWYSISAVFDVYFNGEGRLGASLTADGFLRVRTKAWKPAGMDAVDTAVTAALSTVAYVPAEGQIAADFDVALPSGTWGIGGGQLIISRLG